MNDFVGLKIDGLIKKGYFIIVFLVIFVIPLVRAFKTCPVSTVSSLDCDVDPLLPHTDQPERRC